MDVYSNSRIFKRTRQKRLRFLVLIIVVVIIVLTFFGILHKKSAPILIKPLGTPLPSITEMHKDDIGQGGPLAASVESALEGTSGSYGIFVKNLSSGEEYSMHGHRIYKTASLYKLWVMATVYQQVESKTLSENKMLSEDIAVLNSKFHISPTFAEKKDGKITLSVKDALYQAITISDNYAALLLTEKIGLSKIALFLQKNGFTESQVGVNGKDPISTPFDISLFFEKLYKGNLANSKYTEEMISLLKNQRLNDKIPKYLPSEIAIAHKTGELDLLTHDAGIIYAPTGNYILVAMSDSDNPDLAEERIAEVSKNVFNYFSEE